MGFATDEYTMWFQSTPPHGRRPSWTSSRGAESSFNPRLRTGGDPPLSISLLEKNKLCRAREPLKKCVSIHSTEHEIISSSLFFPEIF